MSQKAERCEGRSNNAGGQPTNQDGVTSEEWSTTFGVSLPFTLPGTSERQVTSPPALVSPEGSQQGSQGAPSEGPGEGPGEGPQYRLGLSRSWSGEVTPAVWPLDLSDNTLLTCVVNGLLHCGAVRLRGVVAVMGRGEVVREVVTHVRRTLPVGRDGHHHVAPLLHLTPHSVTPLEGDATGTLFTVDCGLLARIGLPLLHGRLHTAPPLSSTSDDQSTTNDASVRERLSNNSRAILWRPTEFRLLHKTNSGQVYILSPPDCAASPSTWHVF